MKTIVQVFQKILKSKRKPYMLRVEKNFHIIILKHNLLKIKENLLLQRDLLEISFGVTNIWLLMLEMF